MLEKKKENEIGLIDVDDLVDRSPKLYLVSSVNKAGMKVGMPEPLGGGGQHFKSDWELLRVWWHLALV